MYSFELVYLYTVDKHITFSVKIKNDTFSGESNFCIDKNSLMDCILALEKMYDTLSGLYKISDYDSDDYITYSFQDHGKLIIDGQVGGSYNKQFLKYEIKTDQAELANIIGELKKFMKY